MITLDQVLMLQEKVETVVEKMNSLNERISQLESENDALRSKCAELTKAFSEKTELVSTMEIAQNKIEESILQTLNRLDSIENSLLVDQDNSTETAVQEEPVAVEQTQNEELTENSSPTLPQEPYVFEQENESNSEIPTESVQAEPVQAEQNQESTTDLNGQFDIF